MTPDLIFRVTNTLAFLGWIALIFAGPQRLVASLLCIFILPGLLACVYLGLILINWAGHAGGFGSVTQVQQLFRDPWLVTAGWVHYLAFDLFIGAWQVRDAQRSGIHHGWTVPCLILTFLFGPVGLLLYLLLKTVQPAIRSNA